MTESNSNSQNENYFVKIETIYDIVVIFFEWIWMKWQRSNFLAKKYPQFFSFWDSKQKWEISKKLWGHASLHLYLAKSKHFLEKKNLKNIWLNENSFCSTCHLWERNTSLHKILRLSWTLNKWIFSFPKFVKFISKLNFFFKF